MYLQIGKTRGREYLVIVHKYRDPFTKKVKNKAIKSLGYLDDLKKEFPDPVAHFRAVVGEMNRAQALEKQAMEITLDTEATLGRARTSRKNIGYAAISKLYHELGLHTFFNNNSRGFEASPNTNNIMKILVYSRILFPASKEQAHEQKELYFEASDFALDDVYRCLTQVAALKDRLQKHLHQEMKDKYGRTTELVFYCPTSYCFETHRQDWTEEEGASEEHGPDPIVPMCLFLDVQGIPLLYDLFPDGSDDRETLSRMLDRAKEEYKIGRMVAVEDKGTDLADCIAYCLARGDGYVYAQNLHIASEELKAYALDPEGYTESDDGVQTKSRICFREVDASDVHGERTKIRVPEKQIILYSPEDNWIAKEERRRAISEIYDPDASETAIREGEPVFDESMLREGEEFDGYRSIVTSEVQRGNEEIVRISRGVWDVEEAFKVTRGSVANRPVSLSREHHIQAHFLISFVSLVLVRLLAFTLGNRFPVSQITKSLSKASGSLLEKDWYLFDYADEVTEAVTQTLGVDLSRKYLRLGDFESIMGETKRDR